jgi:Zn-dependent protease with chaperone function
MFVMRRFLLVLAVATMLSGCAMLQKGFPDGAYYPLPNAPQTTLVAHTLWRAAEAAGEDPRRFSFAFVRGLGVSGLSADDAVFYFSEGLALQPPDSLDALVAHEVAHEVLGHAGHRRALSLGVSAGFTALGVVVPGLGLADFVVNPLVLRAFTRDQEIAADLKAVEILRAMGHEAPRRTLAAALRAAARLNRSEGGGFLDTTPALADRLAALAPLEPLTELAASAPAPDAH